MRKRPKRSEFDGVANHRVKKLDEEIDPILLMGHDRITGKNEPPEAPEEKDEQDDEG